MSNPGSRWALDQEQAFLTAFSTVARSYYQDLMAVGFDPAQALFLTSKWQDNYLAEVRRANRAPIRREPS